MALTAIFAALWATLAIAPDTPIGRGLHRLIVVRPATALNRVTRGHVLVALILLTVSLLLIWAAGADGLKVLAMGVPETATWLTTFEISLYVDALAALATATATVRFVGLRQLAETLTSHVGLRKTLPRTPRHRPRTRVAPANDDDRPAPLRLVG